MHVIPWVLLKDAVAFDGDAREPETSVTMSSRLFHLLMRALLETQLVDEDAYLRDNQDVAEAVREGQTLGARLHYAVSGYYEGRAPGQHGFDEAWYVSRYSDIHRALLLGQCASGYMHFRGPGEREWRSPNAAAEADLALWHEALRGTNSVPELQEAQPSGNRARRRAASG